jgi:hypothetical protein
MKLTHKFAEMTPEKRPQDPNMDGTGLRFEAMEHGWEYPDTMPQAIKLIDAEGRSCIYVPTLKTERSSTAKDMCSIWKTNDVCFRERYRHQIPRTSRRILTQRRHWPAAQTAAGTHAAEMDHRHNAFASSRRCCCQLFLNAGIVRGIDVGDCKGTLTVNLHNRWAGHPSIMVHFCRCLAITS